MLIIQILTLKNFFYKTGEIRAYLHKSATSTLEPLCGLNLKGYDTIDVVGFKKGSYMNGTTITWKNTHANTVPSGHTEARV